MEYIDLLNLFIGKYKNFFSQLILSSMSDNESFIEMYNDNHEVSMNVSEALSEDNIYNSKRINIISEIPMNENFISKKSLFKRMPILPCDPVPDMTYEKGHWYYIVFAPFNKGYDPDYNAFDYIRKYIKKYFKADTYVITRERISAKVHFNVLFHCESDSLVRDYGGKSLTRFKLNVQFLNTHRDRKTVYQYITKEYYKLQQQWTRYCDFDYKIV